jgi:hypothetical protein
MFFIFHVLYAFYIFLTHFTLRTVNMHSIFIFKFWSFSGYMNGPPPPLPAGYHPGDEPFAPELAIPDFPHLAIV